MADDEQFSLCWNNFNTNLSAGFHESLCRGDLVDVTLAAEGQLVKAHRLVLSVCSPYFRKMFTTMPANQHAFIFLKDVSHSALKDLIQFMYCGEVNVKQDALPAFISTAEALQIKGLTDGDPPPAQSPSKPSTPAHQTLTTRVRQPSTRPQQTTSSTRSYKIETIEDSGDEVLSAGGKTTTQIVLQTQPQTSQQQQQTQHQQQNVVQTSSTNQGASVVSQKRPAGQRSISSAQAKRIKTQSQTVVSVQQANDPLEAVGATETTTIQAVQSVTSAADKSDSEFIDLPIDLPTKSEPDYSNTEDAGDVDTAGEQETYVEDDSYGDMKYDESYFTENEDQNTTNAGPTTVSTSTPAGIKQQFGETSYTEAGESGAEAQGLSQEDISVVTTWKKLTPVKARKISEPRKENRMYSSKFSRGEQSMKEKPISISDTKNYMDPQNIVKTARNGHVLMLIKKSRLRGVCVECLKRSDGTQKFPKIISHCPQCPGGVWLCEPCFDISHL